MSTPDVWGLGEYERVAERIAPAAEQLVEAAGVGDGTRVLDVAAGTGNVALAAAARGAHVTATDLSPRMVELGSARTEGVEWSIADAQDLPFEDASFDVAVSCFGAMFAPDQQRTADELLRVVRPGGVVAMTGWVQEGEQAAAVDVLPRNIPGALTLMNAWGEEGFARERFAAAASVTVEKHALSWPFAGHADWLEFIEHGPGPAIAARKAIGEDRWPAVRAEMLDCLPPDEPFVLEPPYLLIAAVKG